MKRAATDGLPTTLRIIRTRRRTVELALEEGELVARVPHRISQRRLDDVLPGLRRRLWQHLCQRYVYDDAGLIERAEQVARRLLGDLNLPPFQVRFSSRQRKRWGSCTFDGREGRIRVSSRLRGHPIFVLDHILLHELIHLVVFDHGPRFRALMARSPHQERCRGYFLALETAERLGPAAAAVRTSAEDRAMGGCWPDRMDRGNGSAPPPLPLFEVAAGGAESESRVRRAQAPPDQLSEPPSAPMAMRRPASEPEDES